MTGRLSHPRLLRFYQSYLRDQCASAFMASIAQDYTCATLERLVGAGAVEVRRAAVLALGLLGNTQSTAALGPALRDADRAVRMLAEHGIREMWLRGRSDAERRGLAVVRRMAFAGELLPALELATDWALSTPSLAEVWYLRASIRFELHSFRHAINDARKALQREPYHFLAATLAGQAQLALGAEQAAVQSFRRALRIHPDLEQVRLHVHRLQHRDG